MSVENVTKFYNEVMKDNDLKAKLGDVNEKTLTEKVFKSRVLPEAKAKGYDFTYADVKEYYKMQSAKTELSIDELQGVAGGSAYVSPLIVRGGAEDAYALRCEQYTPKADNERVICGNCDYFAGSRYCKKECYHMGSDGSSCSAMD